MSEIKSYWSDRGFNIVLVKNFPDKQLLLLATGGKHFWNTLSHPLSGENPIDDYTTSEVLLFGKNKLQLDLTSSILFPHGKENYPLQQLGRDLNLCAPSPLFIDIHPEFGLWFAFRALVSLPLETLPEISLNSFISPCDQCAEKWCLKKEGTFTEKRLSCPVATDHQYTSEQLHYHEMVIRARQQS